MKATITINGYDGQGRRKPIAKFELPYYGDSEDLMEFAALADKLARATLRFVNGSRKRIATMYFRRETEGKPEWEHGMFWFPWMNDGDYQVSLDTEFEEATNGQS